MHTWRRRLSVAAQRLLTARWYTPISLVLMLLLVAGSTGELLVRVGAWSPALPAQVASSIRITGPSADGVATSAATSPTATLRAGVLGAVRLPGVYSVAPGATARDLIAAAGGAHTHADLAHIDLTTALQPGQSLYVPLVGEVLPLLIDGKVALNAASAQQLHDALGITLTVARAIVTYRTQHGAFTAVSQLLLVPVTRATYDRIKDMVTV